MSNIRKNFPALKQSVNGHQLAYLDNAASTQKPRAVIDAMKHFYEHDYANVHRGLHELSQRASRQYENARKKVQEFIGAKSDKEIIFTSGTTAGTNLLAYSWGRHFLRSGDAILLTEMEHHANLVPWQILAMEKNLQLRFIPVNNDGTLDLSNLDSLLSGVKLIGITHISNVLGTINPILGIINKAHETGTPVLVDAAQSIGHMPINVQALDVDFLVFSAHKMYGPTGVGVLYAKENILDTMPPFLAGGEMINKVDWRQSTFNELPYKLEAGTPNIAGVIGTGAAVDWLRQIGWDAIEKNERQLTEYALGRLLQLEELKLLGPRDLSKRGGVFSFVIDFAHAHDVSDVLNAYGVAIRSGHHCAMPLHKKLGVAASCRASLAVYNTKDEVDGLCQTLVAAIKTFKP